MKIHQTRKQLFIFFMLGFFIGIIYANLVSKQYVAVSGIFSDYYLKQYIQTEVVVEEYIWYLLPLRVIPFILLGVIGCTKLKKPAVVICLLWTGFLAGMLAVTAVIQLGLKGLLFCFVGIIPQFLFYAFAYIVVLWHLYSAAHTRWDTGKTVFVGLTFLIGLLMEVYVNPVLVKMFIKII